MVRRQVSFEEEKIKYAVLKAVHYREEFIQENCLRMLQACMVNIA